MAFTTERQRQEHKNAVYRGYLNTLLKTNPDREHHERVLKELAYGKRVIEYNPHLKPLPEQLKTPLSTRGFADQTEGKKHLPVLTKEIELLRGMGIVARTKQVDKARVSWNLVIHSNYLAAVNEYFGLNKKKE